MGFLLWLLLLMVALLIVRTLCSARPCFLYFIYGSLIERKGKTEISQFKILEGISSIGLACFSNSSTFDLKL